MLKKIFLLLLMTALASTTLMAQTAGLAGYGDKKGSLGLGYGIPYGGLGLNADYLIIDNLALTVGFGAFAYSAGYSMGAKYYFGNPDKTWRPRVLLVYGINGIVAKDAAVEVTSHEAYMGVTAGLGSQLMFGKNKKHGFDVDLIYVLSSGVYKRCEELGLEKPGHFAFSFGYRYAFTLKM